VRRLLLVGHAPTSATRTGSFPADERLDERARASAAPLAAALPVRCDVLCGPERRCRETAAAAGLSASVTAALADCDYGRWAGLRLLDVAARESGAGRRWTEDPDGAPHGGETLRAVAARVATAAAITHAGVVRAAVVRALAAPLEAFWRIDVAPLSITELHARDGRWTLTRLNHPLMDATSPRAHRAGRAVTTA
jgi:broad specificity phosphatase PhoE